MKQAEVNAAPNRKALSKPLLLLMTSAVSATAANLYYNQPILPLIGEDLGLADQSLGMIPFASQIGYAAALLFISPLGDNMPRRRVIGLLSLLLFAAAGLALSATGLTMLLIACLAIGLGANITQQLIPFAAALSDPKEKGQVMGTVMTGLTVGLLLSRTISGFIGEAYGWRMVFAMSAALAALFGVLLYRFLPDNQPAKSMNYSELLFSMVTLTKQHVRLRRSALAGALWFTAFNTLWATLALHVSDAPFFYDAQQAGLFGVIALAGIGGAKLSGTLVGKVGARRLIAVALFTIALGFAVTGFYGSSLIGLIIGIILIDLGVFAAQVSNQVRIFAIDPAAQSRINAIYMLGYYLGGAFGSLSGVWIYNSFGWIGVSLYGALLTMISLAVNAAISETNPAANPAADPS